MISIYSNYEGDAGWDGQKLLFLFSFEKWYQNRPKLLKFCVMLCYLDLRWAKIGLPIFFLNVIKIGQSCSNAVLCYVIWIWNYICDFVFGKIASLYCMYNSHFSIKWVAKWPPSQVHKEAQISDLLKLRKTQNLWGILNK